MKKIKIEGYLTQQKLETALQEIVGSNWIGSEVSCKPYRWDMAYKDENDTVVVVEFDGDSHYRDPNVIKRDTIKDSMARLKNYRVVRIPYWVQLTTETLFHYFKLNADIEQDFPHGFVTTKWFPASFCYMGIQRFRYEFCFLPESVMLNVMSTLCSKCNSHGTAYVIPPLLTDVTALPAETYYPDYYKQYKKLGGKKSEVDFTYHVKVFFDLTLSAYTGGGDFNKEVVDRETAFKSWLLHIDNYEEAARIFSSVDDVHPYS